MSDASPLSNPERDLVPADGDAPPADTNPDPVRPRQCGRCRAWSPGDPEAHRTALPDWWLCPPCHDTLLGATVISPSAS